MSKIDTQEVEQFLYMEAALLDDNKLDEWLSLFTDDAIYWLPCNDDDIDPNTHVSYIYDDRKLLGDRIWRLQSGLAYGQEPPSKLNRTVTNVLIKEQTETSVKVRANFLITELRNGKQTTHAGKYIYELRKQANTFQIAFKKINLLNNNEPLANISFLF